MHSNGFSEHAAVMSTFGELYSAFIQLAWRRAVVSGIMMLPFHYSCFDYGIKEERARLKTVFLLKKTIFCPYESK